MASLLLLAAWAPIVADPDANMDADADADGVEPPNKAAGLMVKGALVLLVLCGWEVDVETGE